MNRQEKEKSVATAKELMSGSQAVFVVNYKGLSVSSMQSLRSNLRQNGGKLKVIKASLMDIATKEMEGIEAFKANFKDQIGFVFAKGDASAVAKQLANFAKENESLKIITGIFESKVLDIAQINLIASLPSREVLLAHLLATMLAPVSGLARVLDQLAKKSPQAEEKKASGE